MNRNPSLLFGSWLGKGRLGRPHNGRWPAAFGASGRLRCRREDGGRRPGRGRVGQRPAEPASSFRGSGPARGVGGGGENPGGVEWGSSCLWRSSRSVAGAASSVGEQAGSVKRARPWPPRALGRSFSSLRGRPGQVTPSTTRPLPSLPFPYTKTRNSCPVLPDAPLRSGTFHLIDYASPLSRRWPASCPGGTLCAPLPSRAANG
jgi:hypothetical protein